MNTAQYGIQNNDVYADYVQDAALFYLQLIMSEISEDDAEKQAINYIKSNYGVLIPTVKLILGITTHKRNPSVQGTSTHSPSIGSDRSGCGTTCDPNVTTKCQTSIKWKNESGNYSEKVTTSVAATGTYPKRIRRSKYYDINGDLSHIHRDPKYSKRKKVNNEQLMREKEKGANKESRNKTPSSDEKSSANNSIRILSSILEGDFYHLPCTQKSYSSGTMNQSTFDEKMHMQGNANHSIETNIMHRQDSHIGILANQTSGEIEYEPVSENVTLSGEIYQNSEETETFISQMLGL